VATHKNKPDPFLEALIEDSEGTTRPRARTPGTTTRRREGDSIIRAPVETGSGFKFELNLQLMSIPLLASFVFAISAGLAVVISQAVGRAVVGGRGLELVMRNFAVEAGVNPVIFIAVPVLFAMLFAIFIYQNAGKRIERVSHSVSRALLVALLTWASFSVLATWVWCLPTDYLACYGNVLAISGLLGGGPMLAAVLVAGGLMGWLIKNRRLGWIME
jgi:hypothetical protein